MRCREAGLAPPGTSLPLTCETISLSVDCPGLSLPSRGLWKRKGNRNPTMLPWCADNDDRGGAPGLGGTVNPAPRMRGGVAGTRVAAQPEPYRASLHGVHGIY